jgi:hypothetical protein
MAAAQGAPGSLPAPWEVHLVGLTRSPAPAASP